MDNVSCWQCGICGKQGETGAENTLLQCPGCRAVLRRNTTGDSWIVFTKSPEETRELYQASRNLKIASGVLITLFLMMDLVFLSLPAPLFAIISAAFMLFSLFAVLVDLGRRNWCRITIMVISFLFGLGSIGNILSSGCFAPRGGQGGGTVDLIVHIGVFAVFLIIFLTAMNKALFGKNAPTHAQLKLLAERGPDAGSCRDDVLASCGSRRRKLLSFTMIVFYVQVATIVIALGGKLLMPSGDELFHRGRLYLMGGVVKKDEAKAFACFLRGAEKGHGGCQALAASFYLHGRVVKRDLKEGHKFATAAARQEIGLAYDLLARYYAGEFGREVADPEQCRYWSQKEYDAKMPMGELHLAACLMEGRGGERDLKRGFELATAAAEKKLPDAYVLLALYYIGRYDESVADPQEAFSWSEKALQAKHPSGKSCMGICKLRGLGCDADPEQGMALLREAAAAGDVVARNTLNELEAPSP